jgi:hypothetical protein
LALYLGLFADVPPPEALELAEAPVRVVPDA